MVAHKLITNQSKMNVTLLIYILLSHHAVDSANILGVFIFPSKSHCILGSHLLKGLAERGHNVTLLTAYPIEESSDNYHELVMDANLTSTVYNRGMKSSSWYTPAVIIAYRAFATISEVVYQDKVVQQLIKSTDHYDAVIYNHIAQYSLLGFSHKFNATTVLFGVVASTQMLAYTMNYPEPSSYVPNLFGPCGFTMNFCERLHNLYINIIGFFHLLLVNEPIERKLLKDNFIGSPSLDSLTDHIQLVLLNTHMALNSMRPVFENTIPIGGYYMDKLKPLREDVQQFLDKSTRGVIYISFGSNIKVKDLSTTTIQKFVQVFQQLDYDILWKFDIHPPDTPSNVKVITWASQLSVLAHPSVKVFIGHGGKGGLSEAIYYGIPSLLFPFYADQIPNAKEADRAGISLYLNIFDFTVDGMISAIEELIRNPVYKKNVMQRSNLLRNQDMHPMDKANFWINYVIRNPNSTFLQSHASKLPWYEVIMLDLVIFLFLSSLAFLYCIYCICSCMFRRRYKKMKTE